MGLRELGSTLPPGFRFHPSDEELVCHYLCKKMANEKGSQGTMVEVDLHTREPWELPEAAKLTPNEWYFFSFRDRKYATGFRANRATKSGYWKATGKDRTVYSPRAHVVIGMRKTLVFYRGRAPNGMKTNWVMHEFRLETHLSPPKEDWVLCRVFHKRKGEGEKETTTCCAETSPPLWFSTSSAVVDQPLPDYDQDMNGCTLSTITTYQEDDNNNHSNSIHNSSLLQSSSDIYDFTHEQHGLLWDIGQDQFGHEMLNLEELDF